MDAQVYLHFINHGYGNVVIAAISWSIILSSITHGATLVFPQLVVTYAVLRALVCANLLPWGLRKSQRMVCIDSRMLSTAVASPYQTLRELLVGDHK